MSVPHDHQATDTPIAKLLVSMSGAGADEHGVAPPGADAISVKAGHEPDRFEVKAIVMVPVFVVAVLIFTYLLISGIFFNYSKKDPDPGANPQIAKVNALPINDRLGKISSTSPKDLPGIPGSAVAQPRLEQMKQTNNDGPWDDPAFARSKIPAQVDGNSIDYRPEDMRPENFIDPTAKRKLLNEYAYVDEARKIVRVPLAGAEGDKTLKWVLDTKKLPVRKDPVKSSATSDDKSKQSNAGRGGPAQPVAPAPMAPKADDHKKDKH
jgi:hypothetical protein